MAKINNASKAFLIKIQALYDIEKQLEKALPKMEKAASDSGLKAGFKNHLRETKEHSRRLERIFKMLDAKPRKTKSEGIRGILADGDWVAKVDAPDTLKDSMLASAARYAEHYEMAGYMSAIEEAKALGLTDAEELLSDTLIEEEKTDKLLAMGMRMGLKVANSDQDA
jgi:ferritin-like metal-binding protein YciE